MEEKQGVQLSGLPAFFNHLCADASVQPAEVPIKLIENWSWVFQRAEAQGKAGQDLLLLIHHENLFVI